PSPSSRRHWCFRKAGQTRNLGARRSHYALRRRSLGLAQPAATGRPSRRRSGSGIPFGRIESRSFVSRRVAYGPPDDQRTADRQTSIGGFPAIASLRMTSENTAELDNMEVRRSAYWVLLLPPRRAGAS